MSLTTVRVSFVDDYGRGSLYAYFTDQSPKVGDKAVVLAPGNILKIVEVKEIVANGDQKANKPLVAILDMTRYDELLGHIEMRQKAKAELEAMVKDFKEKQIYSELARSNPRAAKLLNIING